MYGCLRVVSFLSFINKKIVEENIIKLSTHTVYTKRNVAACGGKISARFVKRASFGILTVKNGDRDESQCFNVRILVNRSCYNISALLRRIYENTREAWLHKVSLKL